MAKPGIADKPAQGSLPQSQSGGRRALRRVVRTMAVPLALLVCGWSMRAPAQEEGLVVYPPPPPPAFYSHHNDDFTVRVRKPGGPWRDLYEYKVMVDLDNPQAASMVRFDMDGPVEVSVRKNNGDFRVEVDDTFLRTSDDSIAIYGHRWKFYGDSRNFRITNSVLWADIAHPINIGLHGNAEKGSEGEVIEDLVFRNIDILQHDEDDPNYQGAMAVSNSDRNLVRNVLFENIRVEDFQEGQLLNLRVVFNEKYSGAPGRGIENVTFRNVSYTGPNTHTSMVAGYDEERGIRGLLFENLRINGRKMRSAAQANLDLGNHVSDVRFR